MNKLFIELLKWLSLDGEITTALLYDSDDYSNITYTDNSGTYNITISRKNEVEKNAS